MKTPLPLLPLALSAVTLYAQGTVGNITGQVLDPTALGVPSARVTATNLATNVATATTSSAGNYNIAVYPGEYRVIAEAQGFKRYVLDSVTVTASTTVRVDAVLELGSVSESVQVSAALLSVQSENAKVSTSVENRFVDELPLVVGGTMRNPYDLVTIAAQVTTNGAVEMSIGGAQSRTYNATLDGIAITTNRPVEANEIAYAAPSLEAITEFAVDTGGLKAEYGQAAGGVITFTSKSGANAFHGTAYEFLRNEALDARRFFEAKKSTYKQSDFGIAAGGPIRIPKVYNGRNRTFFFVTYEGFRNRVGANTVFQTVPAPETATHLRPGHDEAEPFRLRVRSRSVRGQSASEEPHQQLHAESAALRPRPQAESRGPSGDSSLCEQQLDQHRRNRSAATGQGQRQDRPRHHRQPPVGNVHERLPLPRRDRREWPAGIARPALLRADRHHRSPGLSPDV